MFQPLLDNKYLGSKREDDVVIGTLDAADDRVYVPHVMLVFPIKYSYLNVSFCYVHRLCWVHPPEIQQICKYAKNMQQLCNKYVYYLARRKWRGWAECMGNGANIYYVIICINEV